MDFKGFTTLRAAGPIRYMHASVPGQALLGCVAAGYLHRKGRRIAASKHWLLRWPHAELH